MILWEFCCQSHEKVLCPSGPDSGMAGALASCALPMVPLRMAGALTVPLGKKGSIQSRQAKAALAGPDTLVLLQPLVQRSLHSHSATDPPWFSRVSSRVSESCKLFCGRCRTLAPQPQAMFFTLRLRWSHKRVRMRDRKVLAQLAERLSHAALGGFCAGGEMRRRAPILEVQHVQLLR